MPGTRFARARSTSVCCVIGKLFALGAKEPYRHAEVWAREATSGPDRLRIGGGERPVGLIRNLASLLAEPLYVLVVLSVPRGSGEPGRYESDALAQGEVATFLDEFEELFTHDARAELWIGSTTGEGLLVLDEHDLVYAYGLLDAFSAQLVARGFKDGLPRAPDPHEHHYNTEFDGLEARLIARDWRRVLPLHDEAE
jgi:hypothetical protein